VAWRIHFRKKDIPEARSPFYYEKKSNYESTCSEVYICFFIGKEKIKEVSPSLQEEISKPGTFKKRGSWRIGIEGALLRPDGISSVVCTLGRGS